jgi:hypothetical protein
VVIFDSRHPWLIDLLCSGLHVDVGTEMVLAPAVPVEGEHSVHSALWNSFQAISRASGFGNKFAFLVRVGESRL